MFKTAAKLIVGVTVARAVVVIAEHIAREYFPEHHAEYVDAWHKVHAAKAEQFDKRNHVGEEPEAEAQQNIFNTNPYVGVAGVDEAIRKFTEGFDKR